jgi:serine/threonine-protein kinase RsbW
VRRKFELMVESSLECLPRISEFISQTMKQLNVQNSKDIYAVQLSVAEACTNVIQHAYSNESGGHIVIRCILLSTGNQFVVHVIDWGKSFDPTTIPKPDIQSTLNERREGGLGFFLMQKFMDNIKYTSIQNVNKLVMVKHLDSQSVESEE